MKPFVVKPFIVKPLADGQIPSHWQLLLFAWLALLVGLSCFVATIMGRAVRSEAAGSFGALSVLANLVAGALFTLRRFVRDVANSQAEQTKRLAEQDERIRRLEERLALTPSPPTH
ncbi:MAG: hypothetical protein J0I06_26825 [Planctomycetes bacterium]|nr:hypothetical protein [Planctomycetota bacterium]